MSCGCLITSAGLRLGSLLLCALVIVSCKDGPSALTNACASTQPINELLEDASRAAVRQATTFKSATTSLELAVDALRSAPSATTVQAARFSYVEAALAWQQAAPYAPGPDFDLQVAEHVNAFPLDAATVEAYAEASPGPLPSMPDFERGLPAVEYLLYAEGSVEATRDAFTAQASRAELLSAYASELSAQAAILRSAWEDNMDAFVARTGTGAGSGLSTLVNLASKHFEDLRRDKLGTPFGVSTLNVPNPQTTEAPYANISTQLLIAGTKASGQFFLGEGGGAGLRDYLDGQTTPDATSLARDIAAQYDRVVDLANALTTPLESAVVDERDGVQELYNALSQQVVNLKTDLPAVACVAITYVDNPSDSD